MVLERLVPASLAASSIRDSILGKVVHLSIQWDVLTLESDQLTFSGLNGGKFLSIASQYMTFLYCSIASVVHEIGQHLVLYSLVSFFYFSLSIFFPFILFCLSLQTQLPWMFYLLVPALRWFGPNSL